ncbi:MAG: hypothetical protein GXX84_05090 [Acidobacteria bacterium]|nr:hypothetical protein [Acidobacteriota bacterium]
MEVSIWFRLEDIEGETFHGIPFIPTAILLPKTSVLFPIPKEALSGNGSIQFNYVFQNEMDGNDLDDYGTEITLKFRASDLPQATKQ